MKQVATSQAFIPHPALQSYVQGYVYVSAGAVQTLSPLNIYPVAHTAMSFILDEQYTFREAGTNVVYNYPLCFVGLLDQGRSFDAFPRSIVQVMFKPYGAFKLFGIPQRYFTNQATDVQLLFPEIKALTEQFREFADSPHEIVALLEGWLLKRLAAAKTDVNRIAYVCDEIQKSRGLVRIKDLGRNVGMSSTNLGLQFREKVGFGPKTFSRIVRFNHINKFISQRPSTDWQELTYTFDFFDQNHFIKEFKRFYGCTPSQWHARQTSGDEISPQS